MLGARHAVYSAAHAGLQGAQLAVVHVHAAAPGDPLNAQGIALIDMVIYQCGQKIIGGTDGVKIAGEMQVDVLHGSHLRIAAAGGAALHAKHGA